MDEYNRVMMIGYLPCTESMHRCSERERIISINGRNVEQDATVNDAFSNGQIDERTGGSTDGSTIEQTDRRENMLSYIDM